MTGLVDWCRRVEMEEGKSKVGTDCEGERGRRPMWKPMQFSRRNTASAGRD